MSATTIAWPSRSRSRVRGGDAWTAAIRLWDTATGRPVASWTTDEPIALLGFDATAAPFAYVGDRIVVLTDPVRFVGHGIRAAEVRTDELPPSRR